MPKAADNLAPVPRVVLFDVPAGRFPRLAAELRRVTTQPLRFRWLPTADDEAGRVLVGVEDPPALIVDRLLDPGRAGPATPVVAYIEHAPGVWVELGHSPATTLRPRTGQWLLVRATGD